MMRTNGSAEQEILLEPYQAGTPRRQIVDGIADALSNARIRTLYDDSIRELLDRLLSDVFPGGPDDGIDRPLNVGVRRSDEFVTLTVHDGSDRSRRYGYLYNYKLSAMTVSSNGPPEETPGIMIQVNIALS